MKHEILYGYHTVEAVCMIRPGDLQRIFILDGKNSRVTEQYFLMLKTHGVNVKPELLPWQKFISRSGLGKGDKHQGICAHVAPRTAYDESSLPSLKDERVVLALDQISNPRNLATIIRGAAFFGCESVLLLKNRSVGVDAEVARIAVGGCEFVKIFSVTNLSRALKKLAELGFAVFGMDERGENSFAETDFSPRAVFVIGAEGEGLRKRTREFCDRLIRIPGGRRGIESLNAGVAANIALSEFFRGG